VTPAEELRQRASEVDDEAWGLRWTEPRKFQSFANIARELRELADHLPPGPRSA
jgi:hypothetical protein